MSPGKLSTIKSLATSPIGTTSLDTTALTGYIATAAYSDTLCGAPLIVIFIALDTCYPDSNSTYASVTATSTSITEGVYSDSLCKTVISKNTTDYTDGLCGNDDKVYASTKVFVSARSTFTSSVSMVSER